MKEKTGNISRGKLQKLISEKMKYKKRVRVMQLTYDDLADIKGISKLELRKDLRAKKFDPRVPMSIGNYIKSGIQPEIKTEIIKTEAPKKQQIIKKEIVPTAEQEGLSQEEIEWESLGYKKHTYPQMRGDGTKYRIYSKGRVRKYHLISGQPEKTEKPQEIETDEEVHKKYAGEEYNIEEFLNMPVNTGNIPPWKKAKRILHRMQELEADYDFSKEDQERMVEAIGKHVKLNIPPEKMELALTGRIHPDWIDLGTHSQEYLEAYNKRYKS